MGAPTKNAVIGQYVNGRNAQDDFLQLADNHGGTVFAWIDYQGILRGSFAQGLPGGVNTDVQYNDGGVLGGDSGFTYNKLTQSVQITGNLTLGGVSSTNVGLFPSATLAQFRLGDNSADAPVSASQLSLSGTGLTAGNPLNITTHGTGPANRTNSTIAISNAGGGSTTYFDKASSGRFRILNDSLATPSAGNITLDPTVGLYMDGGANSPNFILSPAASTVPGVGSGSGLITIFKTGVGSHLFGIIAAEGSGDNGEILLDPFNDAITFYGNTSGIAAIGTALAAGTPNKINLPTTTAAASGMFLISDGGSPQQASWTNVMPFVAAPSTATSAGTTGQIAFDSTHLYVCISTNNWIRATFAGGF